MPSRRTPATSKRTAAREKPGPEDVDALVAALDHPHADGIATLRKAIRAIDPRIREAVKWNAPSYYLDGRDHFATFKLRPGTSIQLVLHTGARPAGPQRRFQIADPHGLLAWPAPDRALLTLASTREATRHRADVVAIVRAWIAQLP